MSGVRLVLLDLDGTLLDGSALPGAMWDTCAEIAAVAGTTTADALVAANTAVWQRRWPELEAEYLEGGATGAAIGTAVWQEALHECGIDDDGTLTAAVAAWSRHSRASFRLYDDALPALDALARVGVGVGVGLVTNGAGDEQRRKLDALGILQRFDPLVISGEVRLRKPDPAIFAVALERTTATAADTLFVGDNLWHDLPGALASGIRAVWLDRDGVGAPPDAPRPDRTVRTLAAVVDEVVGR